MCETSGYAKEVDVPSVPSPGITKKYFGNLANPYTSALQAWAHLSPKANDQDTSYSFCTKNDLYTDSLTGSASNPSCLLGACTYGGSGSVGAGGWNSPLRGAMFRMCSHSPDKIPYIDPTTAATTGYAMNDCGGNSSWGPCAGRVDWDNATSCKIALCAANQAVKDLNEYYLKTYGNAPFTTAEDFKSSPDYAADPGYQAFIDACVAGPTTTPTVDAIIPDPTTGCAATTTADACTNCSMGVLSNGWCQNYAFSGLEPQPASAIQNFMGVASPGGAPNDTYSWFTVNQNGKLNQTQSYACTGNTGCPDGPICKSLNDQFSKFINGGQDGIIGGLPIRKGFGHVLGGPAHPPGFLAASTVPPCGACYQIQAINDVDKIHDYRGGAVIFAIDGAAINDNGSVEMGYNEKIKVFATDPATRTKVQYRLVDCETLAVL